MENDESLRQASLLKRAIAVTLGYQNLTMRDIFAALKEYPEGTEFKEYRKEFFFWLVLTASKSKEDKEELLKELSQLKHEQAEVEKVYEEYLRQLGNGNIELGAEYEDRYLKE